MTKIEIIIVTRKIKDALRKISDSSKIVAMRRILKELESELEKE